MLYYFSVLSAAAAAVVIRSNDKLELRHRIEGHQLGVISVDVNKQGTVAASSSLNSQIRLWDIETGRQIKDIDAGPGLLLVVFTLRAFLHISTSVCVVNYWCLFFSFGKYGLILQFHLYVKIMDMTFQCNQCTVYEA